MNAVRRWIRKLWGWRLVIGSLVVGLLAGGLLWWGLPPVARWSREVKSGQQPNLFAPDGSLFVAGYHELFIDTKTGKDLVHLNSAIPEDVGEVRFEPDGALTYLVHLHDPGGMHNSELVRVDRHTGQKECIYAWPPGVRCAGWKFSPDKKTLAFEESPHDTFKLLETETHRVLGRARFPDHWLSGFSPDGKLLALICSRFDERSKYSIRLVDATTCESRHVIPLLSTNPMLYWSFTPDSRYVVVATHDNSCLQIDRLEFWSTATGKREHTIKLPVSKSFPGQVQMVGDSLLVQHQQLDVYDLGTRQLRYSIPTSSYPGYRVSRDGRYLASVAPVSGDIGLFELSTGRQTGSLGDTCIPDFVPSGKRGGSDWIVAVELCTDSYKLTRKLGNLLGLGSLGDYVMTQTLVVADPQNGRVLSRWLLTRKREGGFYMSPFGLPTWRLLYFPPDGQSILVHREKEGKHFLECYDLLPATPWFRLLTSSVIAALALFVLGRSWTVLRGCFRRSRSRRAAA